MTTNEELIKKYKLMEYMNNAFIYIDKLESYKTNLNNANTLSLCGIRFYLKRSLN